jgi:K+-sensing histidine kinase KdpD
VRTHVQGRGSAPTTGEPPQYRARIEVDDVQLGTIIALRDRELGDPTRSETRVLALAADQVAVSLRRDQLRQAATDLEIAHQTDVLKTALIDSVSHDLRTPLASIRATAGGLADPEVAWTDDARRDAASVIDTEAARLDRLVSGLLDLSKITSGGLHPDLEPHELWSVVQPVIDRLRPSLGSRAISVDVRRPSRRSSPTRYCSTSSSRTCSTTWARTAPPMLPSRSGRSRTTGWCDWSSRTAVRASRWM